MPDLSAVAGRRICLDPGHSVEYGGTSSGTGVHEAPLNLAVALRLRDVLTAAGAEVLMTRADEHALDRSSNAADLAARAQFSNARGAEVFVSIHHNADITPGSTKNDLEVYYKISDDGPSLDLGQAMTHSLARRVRGDAPAKRLLPGNYKVLRMTAAPAVLLETSYLTDAAHAAFMATPEGIEAEALAIAEAVNTYFKRAPLTLGAPQLWADAAGGPEVLRVPFSGAVAPVPESVRVVVDGSVVDGAAAVAGGDIVWRPEAALPNGEHELEVYAQNARGAWSRVAAQLRVDRAPAAVAVEQRPAKAADGSPFALYARVSDRFGRAVADGTVVRWSGGTTSATTGGVAAMYGRAPVAGPVTVEAGGVQVSYALVGGGSGASVLHIRDAKTKAPVAGANVIGGGSAVESDANGWVALVPGTVRVAKPGYVAVDVRVGAGEQTVSLNPVEGGVLHGKRIMLDPAYGGRMPGAIGPDGVRASDLNLAVTRRVAQRLREAGAVVTLTRDGDVEVPDSERVRLENRVAPDICVRVSFGELAEVARAVDSSGKLVDAGSAFVGHYPGSRTGIALASALGRATGITQVAPCYLYVVQQAGAPAVVVQPGDVKDSRAYEIGRLWDLGDRIYAGIVDFYRSR